MKYNIKVEGLPQSDREFYAATLAIVQLADAPLDAKVRALRELASFSAQLGQFENHTLHHHHDRKPLIKGPVDPEPGLDKVWRLLWLSA